LAVRVILTNSDTQRRSTLANTNCLSPTFKRSLGCLPKKLDWRLTAWAMEFYRRWPKILPSAIGQRPDCMD